VTAPDEPGRHAMPDPDSLPVDPADVGDCDDTPKLTAEEWAAVAELSNDADSTHMVDPEDDA
jgi:hypothetical protein